MGTVKYTGPVASFHCPTEATIRSLKVHFSPKQLGEGTPSPENVREVVGWDGVEVYRNDSITNYEFGVLGKNKFDYSTANIVDKKRRDDTGATVSDTSGSYCQTLIPVSPNTTYTLSGYPVNNNSKRIYYIDAEENFIERTVAFGGSSYTFTTSNNCYYIQIQNREIGENASWETIQLELGSSATTYEPYDPNKTVYGGWVDLITGEVCEEWGKYTFTGNESDNVFRNYNSTYNGWGIYTAQLPSGIGLINSGNPSTQIKSDIFYSATSRGYAADSDKTYVIRTWSGKTLGANINAPFLCGEFGETTITDFKVWLSQYKPTIMYNLETPSTYHLAPTQLTTFLSHNNIWSNADYVEVEYDLHETQNILARKQFIVANQPHIVKPAAAPLQNFVTDVAAPLKECKAYFEPIQDLHGYDKPWVGGSGKNLFNPNCEMWNYSVYTKDGNNITQSGSDSRGWTNTNFIPLHLAAGTYTISCSDGNNFSYATSLDEFATPTTLTKGGGTFTLSEDCDVKIKHSIKSGNSYPTTFTVQLEKGSTATSYEPYENICPISGWTGINVTISPTQQATEGRTLIVDWTTEAGTVYGGYVDLVTGEVWTEWQMLSGIWGDIRVTHSDDAGMWQGSIRGTYPFTVCHSASDYGINIISNIVPEVSWNGFSVMRNHMYSGNHTSGNGIVYLYLLDSVAPETVIQICNRLKEPVFITTLTPTTLKTLRGTNNIWSNSNGDITIQFWTH